MSCESENDLICIMSQNLYQYFVWLDYLFGFLEIICKSKLKDWPI